MNMLKNRLIVVVVIIFLTAPSSIIAQNMAKKRQAKPDMILSYIANSWDALKRSMNNCNMFFDPKMNANTTVYLPADLPMPENLLALEKRCGITIKRLPQKINRLGEVSLDKISPSGLLYLPYPYIVPGGRFNEMYGWDSYFIIRGLLESRKNGLAHGMIENFFFEIDHYGGTLNGNRTYYLSRTQLPFLAPMIRSLYEADKKIGNADSKWLARAYKYAIKDYKLWSRNPHLAGRTGLSRYYDFGDGPATEIIGPAKSYYLDVVHYFLRHPEAAQPYLLHLRNDSFRPPEGPIFTIFVCNSTKEEKLKSCKEVENVSLNSQFYKGDRTMRESGFDISFRYGPFSANTSDYAPVDLNSLLYKAEKDLAWMCNELGMVKKATEWEELAQRRRAKINKYLWNEDEGLFFDYDFVAKEQSVYPYASTFYPLWAGLASPSQARRVANNLKLFEKPGGVVTSLRKTGVQWDYPYGWAPLQLIAVEGLYNYGFDKEAHRISRKFLSMIIKNFLHDKTIREKYDVVSRSTQTNIEVGYKTNVVGFGWTNGVFLALLKKLPSSFVRQTLGLRIKPESKHVEKGTSTHKGKL